MERAGDPHRVRLNPRTANQGDGTEERSPNAPPHGHRHTHRQRWRSHGTQHSMSIAAGESSGSKSGHLRHSARRTLQPARARVRRVLVVIAAAVIAQSVVVIRTAGSGARGQDSGARTRGRDSPARSVRDATLETCGLASASRPEERTVGRCDNKVLLASKPSETPSLWCRQAMLGPVSSRSRDQG